MSGVAAAGQGSNYSAKPAAQRPMATRELTSPPNGGRRSWPRRPMTGRRQPGGIGNTQEACCEHSCARHACGMRPTPPVVVGRLLLRLPAGPAGLCAAPGCPGQGGESDRGGCGPAGPTLPLSAAASSASARACQPRPTAPRRSGTPAAAGLDRAIHRGDSRRKGSEGRNCRTERHFPREALAGRGRLPRCLAWAAPLRRLRPPQVSGRHAPAAPHATPTSVKLIPPRTVKPQHTPL